MSENPAKTPGKLKSNTKEFLIFISVPLSIILIVSCILVFPSMFAKPKYSFIYAVCPDYNCSYDYSVEGSNITKTNFVNNREDSYTDYKTPELYYYDVQRNSSKKISESDADAYRLDTSNVSPDGYRLEHIDSSSNGFLFWGYSGDYSWYLKSGSLKKKHVNLEGGTYYSDTVKLLGWIEK